MSGPASAALEQELTSEIRRQGIVVWLDKDAAFTTFVGQLAGRQACGEFPFPVVGFAGSFLELLFQLENHGGGLEKQPLLIHMPGFSEDTIRHTPVLELYEAGVRFRKALDSLIKEAAAGRVAPAEVDMLLATRPTLEAADAWLESMASRSSSGLAAVLEGSGLHLLAVALPDPARLRERVATPEDLETFRRYLHKLTGMDAAWEALFPGDRETPPLDRLLQSLGAWILSVEYVHDLRRPAHREDLRRLRALSAPLARACTDLASKLRRNHGEFYIRLADDVEGALADEMARMAPEDLGLIDTFREEENRVLTGAVAALREGQWSLALEWWEARQGDRSFWLARDQLRRWAWDLVAGAARLGLVLATHPRPLAGARSLDEAADLYATLGFEVDREHRRFEQLRLALLESRLPHYALLLEAVSALRQAHRDWADRSARDFTSLCKEHGFLPSSERRQRNLYEQVVHPLTLTGEKVALFLIDAFRFEMATELLGDLKGAGTVVDLKARLAELPTITAVGMNVLAPVARDERLSLAGEFRGFKTGEYTVRQPADRARAMGMRSAGKPAHGVSLAGVCEMSTEELTRSLKPHSLIVVHSKEIDDAIEANIGLPTFESTLRQIKIAWHHLQLAGVKTFVFTADHGFLLKDETAAARGYGRKIDPDRRHVLDDHPREEAGMVSVSLKSLGYEGAPGYLLFLEDTAVFATGNSGATFVHGGNSPQERVIPVLTVTRQKAERMGSAEFAVELEPQPDVLGLHRLRVRIGFAPGTTTSLAFATTEAVDLAFRVREREDVRVLLKDAVGPGKLQTGRLRVPVGEAWTEVFFGLEGPADERVRIEVHHPDGTERVRGAQPETWYDASAVRRPGPSVEEPIPVRAALSWADAIADQAIRKVFLHIEQHGVVTEQEVTTLLGSPRAFRRFSLEFDSHLSKLPFRVRTEAAGSGKRYVREGDR